MGIWDATTTSFQVSLWLGSDACLPASTFFLPVDKSECDREKVWTRLQQISKMTHHEFYFEMQSREDSDSGGEDEGAEEDGEDEEEDEAEEEAESKGAEEEDEDEEGED